MAWRNSYELSKTLDFDTTAYRTGQLFALREFCRKIFPSGTSTLPSLVGSAVELSAHGIELSKRAREAFTTLSEDELKYTIFILFYHHELFVDSEKTDIGSIGKAISGELIRKDAKFPWIFGTVLYDRYFDLFPDRTQSLSFDETETLLDSTPMGVFQQHKYVAGPLGLLESHESRFVPPTLAPMLWSCSDPGCQALHTVELTPRQNKPRQAANSIRDYLVKAEGVASEWQSHLWRVLGLSRDYYSSFNAEQLPWLLINGFTLEELRLVLRNLLHNHSQPMRRRLADQGYLKKTLQSDASSISQKLDLQQVFQMILLARDEWIVCEIENLIDADQIQVPATEIRTVVAAPRHRSSLDVSTQCSRFGIRMRPSSRFMAIARMRSLVEYVYEIDGNYDDLDFNLRHFSGDPVHEKLDKYLSEADPRQAIKDLIFNSRTHVIRAFEGLKYGQFSLGDTKEDEAKLIEKMLWKIGFDIPMYPEFQNLFRRRMERFRQASNTERPFTGHQQEEVRSAGINFFVSLEDVLDRSLSFVTWILLSDHFGDTNWKFNLEESRAFMSHKLNDRSIGGDMRLEINSRGRNALFPLIEGFGVLHDVCLEHLGHVSDYARPVEDYPGFARKSDVELFPFTHSLLLFDVNDADLKKMLYELKETTRLLNAAGTADLRNRMGHQRSDFPNAEEISNALGKIGDVVDNLEKVGICPTVFWRVGATYDEFARGSAIMRDYRGREIVQSIPSRFQRSQVPDFAGPTVIVQELRLRNSSEPVRFRFQESSAFVDAWKNFPKRRTRLPSNLTDQSLVEVVESE